MAPTKTEATPEEQAEVGTHGTLSEPVKGRLAELRKTIEEHEAIAKTARVERDNLMTKEIQDGVSVAVVAEAAGVTRQHVYKNVIGAGRD